MFTIYCWRKFCTDSQFSINPFLVPSKSSFEVKIGSVKPLPQVERSAEKLSKIQKIVNNADNNGLQAIKEIKEKIEKDCTSDYPNAFWTREQYFVDLPYKEDYSAKPQKASANQHVSNRNRILPKRNC
jgi:hypothetical protein